MLIPRRSGRLHLSILSFVMLSESWSSVTQPSRRSPPAEPVTHARALQEQYREREALDFYLQALEVDPDHFEAVCGASYLYGQVGKRFPDRERQKEYYRKSQSLARIDHRFGNEGDCGRPERFSESFAIDPVQVE